MTKKKTTTATTATTHVLMIVDMSGSMAPLANDVRGGFNSYIDGLRNDDTANYRVTVTLFDHTYMPLCVNEDLNGTPKLDQANYTPCGTTALLDAVGRTIGSFDSSVQLGPDDRVLVVIQTDGMENSSREWSWQSISDEIKKREATGRWSVAYLGAGLDTWDQAYRMGVQRGMYVNTASTSAGTVATYKSLVHSTTAYASGQSGAQSVTFVHDGAGTDQ